jgi:apolipoprotein N-acyltransferase
LGSFEAGPGLRTLFIPDLPSVGPLVCYEVIFSGRVTDAARRPDWLANLTDDSWFGDSSGPRQHLSIAQMRAVEEGLPIVRAANNGVSAVIDPYGRVVARMALNEIGVIRSGLPKPLAPTPFALWGNWALVILLAAVLGLVRIEALRRAP